MYLTSPQAQFFNCKTRATQSSPRRRAGSGVLTQQQTWASACHLCSVSTHCSHLERAELPGLCWHSDSLCPHTGPQHRWFICSGKGALHCRAQILRECLESTPMSWDDTGAEMQHKSLMPRKYQWAALAYSFPCTHLCTWGHQSMKSRMFLCCGKKGDENKGIKWLQRELLKWKFGDIKSLPAHKVFICAQVQRIYFGTKEGLH